MALNGNSQLSILNHQFLGGHAVGQVQGCYVGAAWQAAHVHHRGDAVGLLLQHLAPVEGIQLYAAQPERRHHIHLSPRRVGHQAGEPSQVAGMLYSLWLFMTRLEYLHLQGAGPLAILPCHAAVAAHQGEVPGWNISTSKGLVHSPYSPVTLQ